MTSSSVTSPGEGRNRARGAFPHRDCVHEVYLVYTSHGRDAAVVLPSLCGHAPASQWQPSPESSVRETSERCLTGDVYPLSDLAPASQRASVRKNSPFEFWFSLVCEGLDMQKPGATFGVTPGSLQLPLWKEHQEGSRSWAH